MGKYWENRFLKDKARSINLSEKYIKGRLKKYYTEASREIETEMESFYESFADRENITLAEARKRISSAKFDRNKFERMAKENIDLKRKYGNHMPEGIAKQVEEQERMLNTLSKKGAVSRMENLKAGIDNAILKLYDKQQITMFDLLKEGYEDGYYRGMFRIQHGLGVGTDFTRLNERAIRQAVLTDHGKGNFSKRLYQHSKTLSKDIQENLTIGIIRGESIDKMAERISKRLDVSMSNAKRLVRTETAYIHEKATLESYKEAGITTYRFVATLDGRTSEICQELDRKEFPVDKAMPGENFPPMHPNCRSTTEAVFEEEIESNRIARDADGSQYMVPRNMNYQEWKEKYVDKNLTSSMEIPIIKDKKMQYHNNRFDELLNHSEGNEYMIMRMIMCNETTKFILDETMNGAFAYFPKSDVVRYNPSYEFFENYDFMYVQAHELSHRIDYRELKSWKNRKFVKAVDNCSVKIRQMQDKCKEWFDENGIYKNDAALQDTISALTQGDFNEFLSVGHEKKYWQSNGKLKYMEVFANIASIDITSTKSKSVLENEFSELYEAYKEMVKWE